MMLPTSGPIASEHLTAVQGSKGSTTIADLHARADGRGGCNGHRAGSHALERAEGDCEPRAVHEREANVSRYKKKQANDDHLSPAETVRDSPRRVLREDAGREVRSHHEPDEAGRGAFAAQVARKQRQNGASSDPQQECRRAQSDDEAALRLIVRESKGPASLHQSNVAASAFCAVFDTLPAWRDS